MRNFGNGKLKESISTEQHLIPAALPRLPDAAGEAAVTSRTNGGRLN
jgi:hypothetical protein